MPDTQRKTLAELTTDFEEAYANYLKIERLKDIPVVKIGFYVTLEWMMRHNPHPDEFIQEKIVEFVIGVQNDELSLVEDTVTNTVRATAVNRKLRGA